MRTQSPAGNSTGTMISRPELRTISPSCASQPVKQRCDASWLRSSIVPATASTCSLEKAEMLPRASRATTAAYQFRFGTRPASEWDRARPTSCQDVYVRGAGPQ